MYERPNYVGTKLWRSVVVVGGRKDLTNLQSYHSSRSFPSNVKRFPHDTENRARGKSVKTTDGVRCSLLWFRTCWLCEQHSNLHMCERNQASAPQSAKEMRGQILCGHRDCMASEAKGTCREGWGSSDCSSSCCWVSCIFKFVELKKNRNQPNTDRPVVLSVFMNLWRTLIRITL